VQTLPKSETFKVFSIKKLPLHFSCENGQSFDFLLQSTLDKAKKQFAASFSSLYRKVRYSESELQSNSMENSVENAAENVFFSPHQETAVKI